MLDNHKINIRQFTFLVILVTMGDLVLILPSITAAEARQDAWISSALGLVCGLLIVLLLCAVGRLYPNLNFIGTIRKLCGKWIGTVISLFFLSYVLISVVTHTRELGNFMTVHMLPETPIQVIHILFFSLIVIAVRLGIEAFTRTAELFFFWIIPLFVLFIILLSPQINLDYYQPILAVGIKPIVRGSLTAAVFPFAELVVFLMILPHITDTSKIRRHFLIGAFLGGLILLILTVLCVLVLGADMMARNPYAVYSLARKIDIGQIIQRMEVLFTTIWIMTTFIKITLYYYVFNVGLAQLLKLKEYRMLTLPLSVIAFILTITIAPNTTYFNYIIDKFWPFFDLTYAVILPLFLLAIYTLRKKLKF